MPYQTREYDNKIIYLYSYDLYYKSKVTHSTMKLLVGR